MRAKWLMVGLTFMMGNIALCSVKANAVPLITKVELNNNLNDSSMVLHINNQTELNDWQLGFYMPYSFKKVSNLNPNLRLQICQEKSPDDYTDCGPIQYDPQSAGSTTLLSVDKTSPFVTLQAGHQYAILADHNSQARPRNYASFPQSFFVKSHDQVSPIKTDASIYSVSDYDQQKTTQEIKTHIQSNWDTSLEAKFNIDVLPLPVSVEMAGEGFSLTNGVIIHNTLTVSDNSLAEAYQQSLANDSAIVASVDHQASASGIIIKKISDANQIDNNPEGYRLMINAQAITIEALNNTGAFYALQTLRQLSFKKNVLPGVTIIDYPRFKYRGITLDTARHFFSPSEIKKLIDVMAFHKLNTLHIHFSDDEGFRIGLNDYPALREIGDLRGFSHPIIPQLLKQANLDLNGGGDPSLYTTPEKTYSGTYSEDDLKTLIAYANARQITVIPEIDFPGHARALVKALPDAFYDPNDKSQFASVQGFSDNVIPVCTYNSGSALGQEFTQTINTLANKIDDIFNNQNTLYAINHEVSLGGDEVGGAAWSDDSSCQGYWKGLKALDKAHYFFQQFSIANPALTISGWQQMIQNDAAPNDTSLGVDKVPAEKMGHVWIWNTTKFGIAQAASLANGGYPVVLAFADQLYFDLTYSPDQQELGFYWATSYADTHAALTSAASASSVLQQTTVPSNVVGLEGSLWSENLVTYDDLIYMALPKMAGLAEAAWSPSNATNQGGKVAWQSLAARLGDGGNSGFLASLNQLFGVHYRGYPNGIVKEVPENALINKDSV